MEMVEYAAAREAINERRIEAREPLRAPLDLLAQHLITLALGGGFFSKDAIKEVRSAWSYRDITEEEWGWVLDFIIRGGDTLRAYDQFKRVVVDANGLHSVESRIISRFHRMSIGTITSDPAIEVKFSTGRRLGTVEESFISRIKPGSNFYFGGKLLTLKRVRDLTAVVSLAKRGKGAIPVWGGGKSPLSSELASGVRQKLEAAGMHIFKEKEMRALRPSLELQSIGSKLPKMNELLIERTDTREGTCWFVYPFAGRLAHEGLASLISYRMTRLEPMTLSLSFNDYGFHLCSTSTQEFNESDWRNLLSPEGVVDELLECMNLSEMDKRQFREVARVAGLIFQGYPGARKSNRQVQASGGLFFDVFSKYDPHNLLLTQSRREVLDRQLEVNRMVSTLERISGQIIVRESPSRLSPFGFPLMGRIFALPSKFRILERPGKTYVPTA